jgi:cytochrome c553
MIRFCAPALAAVALAAAAPAFAKGDIEAGKKKAGEVCTACHGPDGNAPDPQYPRLAGQYHDYLERALHEYKTGERKNPIMAGFAGQLTDEDVVNVSAFYASLPGGKLTDLHDKIQGD